MCFSSHPDAHPHIEPVQLEPAGKAGDPLADPMNTSPLADGNRGNLRKTHDTRHAQGDIGMALSLSPSQAFVQDPEGKPHVLLFHPQDSIAGKSAAPLLTAPPPALNGAVHSIWQPHYSGRPHRNREWAPP